MNIPSHDAGYAVTSPARRRRPLPGSTLDTCDVNVVHLDAVRAARAVLPPNAELARVTELLALLSNGTRLKMLLALRPLRGQPHRELCVCDLSVVAGASKSLTSHQLRLLRTAGLVAARRAGKLSYYRLAQGPTAALLGDALDVALKRQGG